RRHDVEKVGQVLRAAQLADGEQLAGKAIGGDAIFGLAAEEVVVELIAVVERRAIDGPDGAQQCLALRLAALDGLDGKIAEAVVVARHSAVGGGFRAILVVVTPRGIEELVQSLGRRRLAPGDGVERTLELRGSYGGGEQNRECDHGCGPYPFR